MCKKTWVYVFVCSSLLLIAGTGLLNYIVDPYSVTQRNILNIPSKMVSDDRSEKIIKIENSEKFDNILLGSSRVYLINPLMVSKYAGGTSYNLGVGTAQVEDHLGFLLYLEKLNKFPKVIVLGLDFYSFNSGLETNKYFTRNQKLNFMHADVDESSFLGDFISLEITRASIKTLKVFFGINKSEPRFDAHGASGNASLEFDYFPSNPEEIDIYTIAKQGKSSDFINYPIYSQLSQKRLGHLREIVKLAEKHGSVLKVFITPLYGKLQDEIDSDELLSARLLEFKEALRGITDYYDFLTHNDITSSSIYFGDPSHSKHTTGNLMLAVIFNDKTIHVPEGFGVFVSKDALASK